MSNYTEADVERDSGLLTTGIQSWQPSQDDLVRALAARDRLKSAALDGAKVPGLVEQLEDFRKHLEPDQRGVGWELHVFSAIDTERELLADIERVAPEWSPLNGPHEIVSHLAGKLEERDAEVSALQARVAELEREQSAKEELAFGLRQSLDGATKRVAVLAGERDALRAQVAILTTERDKTRGAMRLVSSERDALGVQVAEARGVLAALRGRGGEGVPPAETKMPHDLLEQAARAVVREYDRHDRSQPDPLVESLRQALSFVSPPPPAETTPAPERYDPNSNAHPAAWGRDE